MSYPQLAVMNISHRYFDLEEFFSSASASGYTCCELWTGAMHLYVDCHGYDSLERVRELSQRYGVRIVGLCPEQNNPKPWNIAARGNEARARTLAYFKNVVDIAAELGAEQVMVSSGWAFLNEPIEDAWGRSASMLRAIAEHAGERGVRLVLEALQPVESMIVNSAADTKQLIIRHLRRVWIWALWRWQGIPSTIISICLAMMSPTCILSMLRQMARRILPGVTATAICAPTWIGWWRAAIAELFRPRPMTGAILPTPQLPMRR